jgi:Golgi phosphoprotein 3 (GPP34)
MADRNVIWPATVHGRSGPLDSRLRGTGLVGDDLFLLAHDDRSGRPLLASRPLGLGIAAGLLAELMLGDQPAIRLAPDGTLRIPGEVPGTVISRHPLLNQIDLEPARHPVGDWLTFLSRRAARDVSVRLEQAGYLTRVSRRFPGRPARLVPADADWAFAPVSRVVAAHDPRRRWEPYAAALAGLTHACGLRFRIEPYLAAGCPAVEDTVSRLTPDLQALVRHTQIAVSSAVLSRL